MTEPRDLDRRIRAFYLADEPVLPDHVRRGIHDAITRLPRRSTASSPAWRRRSWVAIAFVILAVAGAAIVGRSMDRRIVIVGPGPSSSPAEVMPSPSSSGSPSPSPSGDPKTGLIQHDLEGGGVAATVWAPPEWAPSGSSAVKNGSLWLSAAAELKILDIASVFKAPCTLPLLVNSERSQSVESLAQQIQRGVDYVTTPLAATTVDGYDGVAFDLIIPDDLSRCDSGSLRLWMGQDLSTELGLPGERHRITILDVDGYRLMIDAKWGPEATPEDQAALLEILRTIELRTMSPGPLATPSPSLSPTPSPSTDPETGLVRHDLEGRSVVATVSAPPEWEALSPNAVHNAFLWTSSAAQLQVMSIDLVFADPCRLPLFHRGPGGVGGGVAGLSKAIRHLSGTESTPERATVVDGYDGVTFDLQIQDDLSGCAGSLTLAMGSDGTLTGFAGAHHRIAIVEVDGHRLVIDAEWRPETTLEIQAELLEMLRTIELATS